MAMTIEMLTQRVELLEKQLALLDSDNTKAKTPKKDNKSKKTNDSDDEKPKKKRVSGYILYSNATRDEVRDALTIDDVKPKNTDIMKELAKRWKELTEEDQEPWNNKAKLLKEQDL